MNAEEFRKSAHQAVDDIADYYAALANDEIPVKSAVKPGYLAEMMNRHEPPTESEEFATIRADFHKMIMPGITHWQSPNFFAYFPANILTPKQWSCSPACTELEACVMDWCCHMLGLSESFLTAGKSGGSIIMGSASESCLTAAIGAREKALAILAAKDPNCKLEDIRARYSPKMVIYGSTQTHSLGAKAALILGLTFRAVAVYEKDNYALRGDNLQTIITEDMENGFIPFMVIGSLGTTSSGAIDQLEEIGKIAKAIDTLTYYVDAAWAGMYLVCPEFREISKLDAINEYADVFNTNFHKAGLVNFDCSTLFVRDRTLLTDALDVTPPYLRTKEADAGTVIDYRNWQLSLGRKFRSLKLWFALRGIGVKGFQEHLRKSDRLARELEEYVQKSDIFELVTPRSFGLVNFRLKGEPSNVDELNKQFYSAVNERSDLILTSTILPGNVTSIRWAIGAPLTESRHIQESWTIVNEVAQSVIGSL